MNISLGEWETLIFLMPIKKSGFSPVQNICPKPLDETATVHCVGFVRCDPGVLTTETDLASLLHGFGWTREGDTQS